MLGYLSTAPRIISLSPLSLVTDVTDATLEASGLLLGTKTGAGGTASLTESFYLAAAHGSMDSRKRELDLRPNPLHILFFFPSFSLRDVLSNPTASFEGKRPHLRRRLTTKPLHQIVS